MEDLPDAELFQVISDHYLAITDALTVVMERYPTAPPYAEMARYDFALGMIVARLAEEQLGKWLKAHSVR